MSKLTTLKQALEQTKTQSGLVDVLELMSLEQVKNQFVKVYQGANPGKDGNMIFESEKMNLLQLVEKNELLSKCTPISIFKLLWIRQLTGFR